MGLSPGARGTHLLELVRLDLAGSYLSGCILDVFQVLLVKPSGVFRKSSGFLCKLYLDYLDLDISKNTGASELPNYLNQLSRRIAYPQTIFDEQILWAHVGHLLLPSPLVSPRV